MTRAELSAFIDTVHFLVPPDVIRLGAEHRRQNELATGQLRIGTPADWYARFRWSDQPWTTLHTRAHGRTL